MKIYFSLRMNVLFKSEFACTADLGLFVIVNKQKKIKIWI